MKMTIEQIKAKMETLSQDSLEYRAFEAVLHDRATKSARKGPFADMEPHTTWSSDENERFMQEAKIYRALNEGD
jgi:hypothetical protein